MIIKRFRDSAVNDVLDDFEILCDAIRDRELLSPECVPEVAALLLPLVRDQYESVGQSELAPKYGP